MDSVQMAGALNTTLDGAYEDFLVGNSPNKPGFGFNGTIGELKVYDEAFTDSLSAVGTCRRPGRVSTL